MDSLDLARWQFAITTVYHFLFVPITIGMAFIVAGFQTAWYRTGKEKYLRLTKYFGKLFLINFAMGVVTGIVQEFQFGMNWSDYSPLRRRHLRCAAGHRGAARVLPRVDVPRAVDLRVGPAAEEGAPRHDLDRGQRHPPLRLLHPRCELVHAEPGRLHVQRGHGARRAHRLHRRAHQQGGAGRRSRTRSPVRSSRRVVSCSASHCGT